MKVEIWSDVMCPFCYIGKRKFEAALKDFEDKENIEVEWKSYQLNPELKTDPAKTVNAYLAEIKGWSLEHAVRLNERVTEMAAEAGLEYHLDKAIVANSMDAHRLSHLAKQYGVQDQLEELLFRAYFTDGKNTADHAILKSLGMDAGIPENAVAELLAGDAFSREVQMDAYEAGQLGARGVPFFVFDRKFGISGAQDVQVFKDVLRQAFAASEPATE